MKKKTPIQELIEYAIKERDRGISLICVEDLIALLNIKLKDEKQLNK